MRRDDAPVEDLAPLVLVPPDGPGRSYDVHVAVVFEVDRDAVRRRGCLGANDVLGKFLVSVVSEPAASQSIDARPP